MSDSTVEIKITGTVDNSVKASSADAAASMDALVARNKAFSAQLAELGNDLSKATPEMLGLGAAAEQMGTAVATGVAKFQTLQAGIDASQGLDRSLISAASSAKAFTSALGANAGFDAISRESASVAARIAEIAEAEAAVAAKSSAFQGLTNAFAGIGVEAKSAAQSASIFDAAIAPQATQAAIARDVRLAMATEAEAAAALGAGLVGFGAQATQAAHGTAGLAREFIVVGHEVVSGNFSRIPGSLMVLAERMGGLGSIMFGPIGAAAALTAGLGFLLYKSLEEEKALDGLTEGFALTGRGAQFTSEAIKSNLDLLTKLPGVSKDAALGFMQFVARHAEISAVLADQTEQLLPAFIKQYGKDAPEAVGKLTETLSNLTESGFRKLDTEMLNLAPAEYEIIENLIRTGDTAQAVQRILADLSAQSGVYIKSLGDKVYDVKQNIDRVLAAMTPAEKSAFSKGLVGDADVQKLRQYYDELAKIRKLEADDDQQGKDNRYKRQLDDADKVNESLDRQAKITKQIALFQQDLAEAKKRGDSTGAASFTAAIASEQKKLTELQTQDNEKVYRDFVAKEEAKASAFKSGSAQRIQAAQEEVQKAGQIFGTESSQYSDAVKKLNTEKLASSTAANRQESQEQHQLALDAIAEARNASQEIISNDHLTGAQKLQQARQVWTELLNGDKLNARDRAAAVRDEASQESQLTKQSARETEQIARDNLNTTVTLFKQQIEDKKAALDFDVQNFRISESQKFQLLREYENEEARSTIDALTREQASYSQGTVAWQRYQNQIVLIKSQTNSRLAQLDRQEATQATQSWRSTIAPIEMATNSILENAITMNQSFLSNVRSTLARVVLSYAESRVKIEFDWLAGQIAMALGTQQWSNKSLFEWLAMELGMTSATTAAETERLTAKETAAAVQMATASATNVAMAEGYSALAATGAASAVASIPYVGPALAVAASAETFAMLQPYVALAAFDVGTSYVPRDMTARIHAGEIIVPRTFSDDIRAGKMTLGGGQDSGTGRASGFSPTFQISAINSRGVEAVLKNRKLQRNMAMAHARYLTLNPSARGNY